jgi:hypothetical protein
VCQTGREECRARPMESGIHSRCVWAEMDFGMVEVAFVGGEVTLEVLNLMDESL